MNAATCFSHIEKLIAIGGPEPSEYSLVTQLPDLSGISLLFFG